MTSEALRPDFHADICPLRKRPRLLTGHFFIIRCYFYHEKQSLYLTASIGCTKPRFLCQPEKRRNQTSEHHLHDDRRPYHPSYVLLWWQPHPDSQYFFRLSRSRYFRSGALFFFSFHSPIRITPFHTSFLGFPLISPAPPSLSLRNNPLLPDDTEPL